MDLETDFSSHSDYDELANELCVQYPASVLVWTHLHSCWNTS